MKLDLIRYLNETQTSLGLPTGKTEIRLINETKGYGRFATDIILKNEIVYRYGGMWVTKEERDNFNKDYFHLVDGAYFFQGGLTHTLNGTHNHSCNPNAYIEDNTIRALVDIYPGMEVTVDYSSFVVHDYVIIDNCQCGADDCRKTITGQDWKLHNLAKKYKNRVSSQVRRLSEDIQNNSDT